MEAEVKFLFSLNNLFFWNNSSEVIKYINKKFESKQLCHNYSRQIVIILQI